MSGTAAEVAAAEVAAAVGAAEVAEAAPDAKTPGLPPEVPIGELALDAAEGAAVAAADVAAELEPEPVSGVLPPDEEDAPQPVGGTKMLLSLTLPTVWRSEPGSGKITFMLSGTLHWKMSRLAVNKSG